jgi:hypothetical protein
MIQYRKSKLGVLVLRNNWNELQVVIDLRCVILRTRMMLFHLMIDMIQKEVRLSMYKDPLQNKLKAP